MGGFVPYGPCAGMMRKLIKGDAIGYRRTFAFLTGHVGCIGYVGGVLAVAIVDDDEAVLDVHDGQNRRALVSGGAVFSISGYQARTPGSAVGQPQSSAVSGSPAELTTAHDVHILLHTTLTMSYVILGRAIKNEYLALGTLFATAAIAISSTGGSKKEAPAPGAGKSTLEQVKNSVKFNAGSSEEEQLFDSIKNFIAEAEKESKH
ncbi:hypothetical protein EIP91_007861 [Steccherinum ochraceum]|uniref:Uncharacterized protein n=1 Tax=Steccherinum ochraceum TaxID=92696 RepID=A0A4R0R609_9APHY|nr:hypothetical protein EIP91_007861 [Steccherinum ochraceum]